VFCTSLFAQKIEFSVQTGHAGVVNQVEFSNEGDIFVTAGYDNNIVIWDAETGKQIRMLLGHKGIINDVKFIHGDSLLVSCSQDKTVKVWDTYSGEILQSSTLSFVPERVAFDASKDDIYIAAISLFKIHIGAEEVEIIQSPKRDRFDRVYVSNEGVIIFGGSYKHHFYQRKDGEQIKAKGSILCADFSDDNQVFIVSSAKGNLLRYKKGVSWYELSKTLQTGYVKSSSPKQLDVRDTTIVLMDHNNYISSYHIETGKLIHHYKGHFNEGKDVSFHPNGKLFVSCGADGHIYLWEMKSGNLVREFKSKSSSINFAKFSKDNEAIVLGYDNGYIKHWDLSPDGGVLTHKFQLSLRKIKKGWKYHVLEMLKQDSSRFVFRVVLTKYHKNSQSFKECRFYDFTWDVKYATKEMVEKYVKNYNEDKFFIDDLIVKENRSLTIGNRFLIANGTQFTQTIKGAEKEQVIKTLHSNDIKSLDYNAIKQMYITASWDGKVYLYDKDFEPIASLVAIGTSDFVMLVQDNFYYATKGALKYVGFVQGHQIHSFDQFDVYFNRPDVVYATIPYAEKRIVENFKKLYEKRSKRLGVSTYSPDLNAAAALVEVEVVGGVVTKKSKIKLHITARDEKGLSALFISVGGVPYLGMKGKKVSGNFIDETIEVELGYGLNKIDVWVEHADHLKSKVKSVLVKSSFRNKKNTLYFVGIGVSAYQDTARNLQYATKDILEVASVFVKTKACKKAETLLFLDENVVLDSLKKIKDFIGKAGVDDMVIIYYAGHGALNQDLDYFLATYNNDFYKPEKYGLSYCDLESELLACKSRKKLLFLDACHSGEVDEDNIEFSDEDITVGEDIIFRGGSGVTNLDGEHSLETVKMLFADLKENNGITVISSAGGADYAVESDVWENGAFTYSLIRGLKKNESDLDGDGKITVFDLLNYLQIDVPKITNGYQMPTYRSENIENDFVIWKK